MIEVYGPYVVNLLAELGDSKRVCQAIKFCPHHTSEQLLGAEKCTWGPSYWCQTKMHATACRVNHFIYYFMITFIYLLSVLDFSTGIFVLDDLESSCGG